MKKNIKTIIAVVLLGFSFSMTAFSEESTLEKAQTSKNKAVDSVKKSYRKMDDKICETVNGKTNCVSKKIKNKIKNTTDQIKTDGKEIENKID